MLEILVHIAIVIGVGVLWFAGLRPFLQSDLSRNRKVGWTAFLFLVGIGIRVVLPLSQVWSKFFLLIVFLPVLGLTDILLLRSGRSMSFCDLRMWVRGLYCVRPNPPESDLRAVRVDRREV
jgi:hypothetical protein